MTKRHYHNKHILTWFVASSKWPYTIFSDKVSGLLSLHNIVLFSLCTDKILKLDVQILNPTSQCITKMYPSKGRPCTFLTNLNNMSRPLFDNFDVLLYSFIIYELFRFKFTHGYLLIQAAIYEKPS